MPELWAGTDAGKAEHHCVVIDTDAERKLSRRVANDEAALLELIADVLVLSEGEPVTGAIDLNAGGAALMIALLTDNGQRVLYIPGRTVHHAARSYRGEGKTDAKDAFVIADQARMRRDLQMMRRGDEIAVDLRILTSRRLDLAADRTRAINRMRAQMLEYFPALERAFDYKTSKAALVLLTTYQTPAALRRIGNNRLATWLKNRKVRNYKAVAATALGADLQGASVVGEGAVAYDEDGLHVAAAVVRVPGEHFVCGVLGGQVRPDEFAGDLAQPPLTQPSLDPRRTPSMPGRGSRHQ